MKTTARIRALKIQCPTLSASYGRKRKPTKPARKLDTTRRQVDGLKRAESTAKINAISDVNPEWHSIQVSTLEESVQVCIGTDSPWHEIGRASCRERV